jgi:hypothetical protein
MLRRQTKGEAARRASARAATLDAILLDPSWLTAKLTATGNTAALVADYDRYAVGEPQKVIGRTLRLTAGICARDQRQLMPQLLGRLMANEVVVATGFLDAARQSLLSPAILEQHASLTPPGGAETARLEGHSYAVSALCVLPDGRLASGSYDGTIRLWDMTAGAETARLEGHSGEVGALCMLPGGRLASGSSDGTIRLWDTTTGAETARLEADAPLLCLTALADLHLVAGDTLGRLHWLEVVVGSGSTHDKDSMGQRRQARLGTVGPSSLALHGGNQCPAL